MDDLGEAITTGDTHCAECGLNVRTYYTTAVDPRPKCEACAVREYRKKNPYEAKRSKHGTQNLFIVAGP